MLNTKWTQKMDDVFIVARSEKGRGGYPLQLYVRHRNRKLRLGLGVYIRDKKNLVCNQIVNEADNIPYNITLANTVSQVRMFLLDDPSYDDVVEFCKAVTGRQGKKEKLLVDVLDEFVSTKLNKSTIANYGITRKKILLYDPAATLESVDRKWLCGIEAVMRSSGMSTNGLAIRLRDIRAVFNYALDEEYTQNYPFRKFKIKQEQTAKRALTKNAMASIVEYECSGYMAEYRDMFMLMFYLIGINAADLLTLPKGALKSGRIVYHRKKTGKLYSIKVEPEALRIINRHRGNEYLLCPHDRYNDYRDYLHHMNDGLKNLGRGYKKGVGWSGEAICPTLTSYCARHTWATIAFEIGVPKDVISLALGHSFGVSVTDTYINYSTRQVDEANRMVIDSINDLQTSRPRGQSGLSKMDNS